MRPTRQAVVLVGGRGTRLGSITANTPKPMLEIEPGQVFLDYLLRGLVRQGFRHVVMLAGHLAQVVHDRYAHSSFMGAEIDVLVEPEPLGTGGALRFAQDHLADQFALLNGDTLFDVNLRALEADLAAHPDALGCIALRRVEDTRRYGSVALDGSGTITGFREKDTGPDALAGLINGGVALLRKACISDMRSGMVSMESEIYPPLVARGVMRGVAFNGYFLDIGLPETLDIARADLPQQRRPVLFLDRDGVLNVDRDYVGQIEDWEWVPGARSLIRRANDTGVAVVVVTNQAGVARGYYDEAAVLALHERVNEELMQAGAFVDAFYYASEHPEAVDAAYRVPDPLSRKPRAGMIARAVRTHRLDPNRALLVGDRPSDLEAAKRLGIPAVLFRGQRLDHCIFSSPLAQRLFASPVT
jgi:D-glycero-D-manno-heptose 1,7-bisphosphate phosphatase